MFAPQQGMPPVPSGQQPNSKGFEVMGLFDFLGGKDPSKAANKYLNKIPGMANQTYNPYIEAGQRQLPGLEEQYGMMMNDPGAFINKIGGGYQKSPGFDFAMQQALQGSGNAMAAGGMAGSPMHEQANMGLATNLANQDYNQWLQTALGEHQQGLAGGQGLYNTGSQASDSLARMLADTYGSQASNAFAGAQSQNNMMMGGMGALAGLGIGAMTGNPWAAFYGMNQMGGQGQRGR
jgi:hypothetical protein